MAQYPTTWRTVEQLDTDCRPTKKGDPQVGVRTEKGWIKISGDNVLQVKMGDKIEISEPTQFGKSWYARLQSIDPTNKPRQPAPEPKNQPTPEPKSELEGTGRDQGWFYNSQKNQPAPEPKNEATQKPNPEPQPQPEPKPSPSYALSLIKDGKIPWLDCVLVAKAAHSLALELEPDHNDEGAFVGDRSKARAAIVDTIMIAFSNGRIDVPELPDDGMQF